MPLFLENDGDDIAFSLIYKFCKNVLQSCSGCFRYHGKLGIETVTDQIRQLASEDIAVPDALIIISIIPQQITNQLFTLLLTADNRLKGALNIHLDHMNAWGDCLQLHTIAAALLHNLRLAELNILQ